MIKLTTPSKKTEISFVKDSDFLHTTFYRISFAEPLSADLEDFIFIIWECLNIFKEAFPSEIELFQENFDVFCGFDAEAFKTEIFRREITYIQSRSTMQTPINTHEFKEITYLLAKSLSFKHTHAMKICLDLLNSSLIPSMILFNSEESLIDLLEKISQEDELFSENEILSLRPEFIQEKSEQFFTNKKIALSLLSKTLKIKNFNQQKSAISFDFNEEFKKFKLEGPQNLNSQMFQLRESLDLERITYILTDFSLKNQELLHKNNLFPSLNRLMMRYTRGELGIDASFLTKFCVFHNKLLHFFMTSAENEKIIAELLRNSCLENLSLIIQEGVLNIVQNSINFENSEEVEKEQFLRNSVSLMEKLASFYNCKDIIKETLNYCREIIENYLGDNINRKNNDKSAIYRNLEGFEENLAVFYKKISVLIKNIDITEQRYREEKGESPKKSEKTLHFHRLLSQKTKDFLQKESNKS